jgi:hypothetical protein
MQDAMSCYLEVKKAIDRLDERLVIGELGEQHVRGEMDDDEDQEAQEEAPVSYPSAIMFEDVDTKMEGFMQVFGKPVTNILDVDLKKMQESSYGDLKTGETASDAKVRRAYETRDVAFSEAALSTIKRWTDVASQHLLGGRPAKAVFNKLNVYTEGCHFSAHVDTPRDGMLASMVVLLPGEFEGGELLVDFHEEEWTDLFEKRDRDVNMAVACFFPDVTHKVDPVTSGTRGTLSFFLDADAPEEHNKQKQEKKQQIFSFGGDEWTEHRWQAATASRSATEPIGVFLSHKYSLEEIAEQRLKAGDHTLLQIINTHKKHAVELFPVVIKMTRTDPAHDASKRDFSGTVYRFTPSDIKALSSGADVVPFGETVAFVGAPTKLELCDSDSERSAAYTGNESRDGYLTNFYFSSVLIARPKKISKKRKREQDEQEVTD